MNGITSRQTFLLLGQQSKGVTSPPYMLLSNPLEYCPHRFGDPLTANLRRVFLFTNKADAPNIGHPPLPTLTNTTLHETETETTHEKGNQRVEHSDVGRL